VAGLLFDLVTAPFGSCGKALHRLGLIHKNRGDLKFVDICTVVVLGIGDDSTAFFKMPAAFLFVKVRMFNA
jgi:hypothetical protein